MPSRAKSASSILRTSKTSYGQTWTQSDLPSHFARSTTGVKTPGSDRHSFDVATAILDFDALTKAGVAHMRRDESTHAPDPTAIVSYGTLPHPREFASATPRTSAARCVLYRTA